MENITLSTQSREKFGTRASIALRAAGSIPANVVGAGEPSVSLSINQSEFEAALRKEARVFDLKVDGKKTVCILREVQWDYMGDLIQNVEFLRDPDGSAAQEQAEAAAADEAERDAAAKKVAEEAEAAATAALEAAEAAEDEAAEDGEGSSSDEEE
ncbi:MAG: hypothetical protein OTJ44_01675 [Planctomycetota bacterium]|jgi:large subunit ribosomal protein L25|nr:hypothetical protein [Planctomycetota bacterium]